MFNILLKENNKIIDFLKKCHGNSEIKNINMIEIKNVGLSDEMKYMLIELKQFHNILIVYIIYLEK